LFYTQGFQFLLFELIQTLSKPSTLTPFCHAWKQHNNPIKIRYSDTCQTTPTRATSQKKPNLRKRGGGGAVRTFLHRVVGHGSRLQLLRNGVLLLLNGSCRCSSCCGSGVFVAIEHSTFLFCRYFRIVVHQNSFSLRFLTVCSRTERGI